MSEAEQVINQLAQSRQSVQGKAQSVDIARCINGLSTCLPLVCAVLRSESRDPSNDLAELLRTTKSTNQKVYRELAQRGFVANEVEMQSVNAFIIRLAAEYWIHELTVDDSMICTIVDVMLATGISGESILNNEMLGDSLDFAADIHIATKIATDARSVFPIEEIQYRLTDILRTVHSQVLGALEIFTGIHANALQMNNLKYTLLMAAGDIYTAEWAVYIRQHESLSRVAIADNREAPKFDAAVVSLNFGATFSAYVNGIFIASKVESDGG